MNPPTMPWYGSIHSGEMPRWKSAFFDEKNVKGKAEQRKKAVAAHLQIRGDLTDRNVKKKGIRKCRLTIMLFCPTSFLLGYRKRNPIQREKERSIVRAIISSMDKNPL